MVLWVHPGCIQDYEYCTVVASDHIRVYIRYLLYQPYCSGGTLPSNEGQLPNWSLRLSVEARR